MNILGLDIATKTGAAVLCGERLVHAEAFRPKGTTDPEIFHGFRTWLRPLIRSFDIQYAAIEEPLRSDLTRKEKDGTSVPISNMSTFLRLYGLRGHAIEVFHALNVPCLEVNQSSWRKAFLRNGRADKDMALAQCKLMRWPVTSKDAAEACGVAWWLSGQLQIGSRALPGDLFAQPQLEGAA